jgi:hypothetical protein
VPVLEVSLRLLAVVGPAANWIVVFIAALVAVLVLYLGIALWATLCAQDPEQQRVRYQVFRDLLELFLRRRRS